MSEKIITLATLTYMRAQLLSAMLERNGIDCFMTNMDESGGVQVKIRDDDSTRAYKIFEDFRSSYGEQKRKAVEYMKSIRRILVPVDFTDHAENAAEYALHIAAFLKADIKLINAYLNPLGTPQTYLESYSYQVNIDHVIREIEEETANSLKAMAGRLKEVVHKNGIKGVDVYYDLFKGNASDVILSQIDEWKPALVVMGTRGNEIEGLRSFGSVTASLISKVKIPLLAVPKDYDARNFKTPKRVLYATNFEDADYGALRRLVGIIKPFDAKIYCVHAAMEESSKMEETQLRAIRNYMYDSMGVFNVECGLLETMDIQEGLEDFIREQEIDVLAVTTHRRNFLMRLFDRSMTRKFLFQAHVPLLVFQSRANA